MNDIPLVLFIGFLLYRILMILWLSTSVVVSHRKIKVLDSELVNIQAEIALNEKEIELGRLKIASIQETRYGLALEWILGEYTSKEFDGLTLYRAENGEIEFTLSGD